MKNTSRILQVSLLLGLLLTQFNNCGSYTTPQAATGQASVSCTTANCVNPSHNNLKIVTHLSNGEFQVPAAISLAGLAAALAHRFRGKARPACPWLSLLVPSIVGIIFWMVASPDFRFAQFAIWTTAATLGAWGIPL